MLLLDNIERMAHGAGLSSSDLRVKQLAKIAYDLGMQHEREACAEMVENLSKGWKKNPGKDDSGYIALSNAAHFIRKRGKP